VGAEHATAEKVAAPAELREQEALAPDEATPEEARVFMLQRQAGNRAVTALLRGQTSASVQRAMTWTPALLKKDKSFKERVGTTFMTTTYDKIIGALEDFNAASTDEERLWMADVVIGLTDYWIGKHGSDPKQRNRRQNLVSLVREARGEAFALRMKKASPADQAYIGKIASGGFEGVNKGRTSLNVLEPAGELAAGRTTNTVGGADAKAAKLVAKYRLTPAELAAIRIFTMPDYQYINPAMAGSTEWLASNVLNTKDDQIKRLGPRFGRAKGGAGSDATAPGWASGAKPAGPGGAALGWARGLKSLMEEGSAHGARLSQALQKLDPYAAGVAYRGERISMAAFNRKYKQGAELPFRSFASAAKIRTIAEGFANGGGDIRPGPDQTVSVLAVVNVRSARDISQLSGALKVEEEVLIMPGTTFTVDRVVTLPPPADPGTPPATEFREVHLTESY
jgi:hypothetical protein